MANVEEVMQKVKGLAPYVQDSEGLRNFINSQINIGKQADDITYEILRNPGTELIQGAKQAASKIYDPMLAAKKSSVLTQKAGIADEFAGVKEQLQQEGTRAQSSLEERMNQLGLLQSGATAAGIGDIKKETLKGINRADIQRAIKSADLVLEEAGYTSDIATKREEYAGNLREKSLADYQGTSQFGFEMERSKLGDELSKRGFDLTKVKSISDIYSQFLDAGEVVPPWLYDQLKQIGEMKAF